MHEGSKSSSNELSIRLFHCLVCVVRIRLVPIESDLDSLVLHRLDAIAEAIAEYNLRPIVRRKAKRDEWFQKMCGSSTVLLVSTSYVGRVVG